MTEVSWLWDDTATGDGSAGAGYSNDQFTDILRKLFVSDRTKQGVLRSYANELVASGGTSPVAIATGFGIVDGQPYENDASVDVAIPTPASNTRIDRIVLRKDFAGQTVRITRIAGAEGGSAPAMTQTDGTTWDIPLWQVSITTGGVITLTDERRLIRVGTLDDLIGGFNGWQDDRQRTWTYASATTFTVSGDLTAYFRKGAKIRLKQGGAYKYFYIAGSSYGAPNTTVTVTGGSDYSLANAAITDNWVSFIENPEGFPDWFNWSPTITGYSANPTTTVYRFKIVGTTVMLAARENNAGTSNATTATYSLPVTAKTISNMEWAGNIPWALDNGASAANASWRVASGATVLDTYKDGPRTAWTSSGSKAAFRGGMLAAYEMA